MRRAIVSPLRAMDDGIRLATLTIERREILTPSPQRYEAGTRGGDDGK